MTIVAARRYRDGKVVEYDLLPCREKPGPEEFDWIGLVEPSAEELKLIQEDYGLHPLAVEDALTHRQDPKTEAYGTQLFVLARTAAMGEGEKISYGQTSIFLGERFIITVRQGSERAHVKLRDQLESTPERLAEGPDFVLHAVLDYIVDGYGPLLDEIEEDIGDIEDQAIGNFPDSARIRRIFRLRRTLRHFEGIAEAMEEVASKLWEVEQPSIDPRARPYFRDVFDHTQRAARRTRWLNDTLGGILQVASLLEQKRTGAITRQLAAWAAILAVPTAIAGIYGMNFKFMPELTWRYGYFIILGITALTCAGLFYRFKRIGWL
ncbi:MAG: magnesium and cobalt transport protein CorA [Porphyrobacter sp.]|nr:magnesium and cobalt transport protein CorA [Porphyrobacter sp.]